MTYIFYDNIQTFSQNVNINYLFSYLFRVYMSYDDHMRAIPIISMLHVYNIIININCVGLFFACTSAFRNYGLVFRLDGYSSQYSIILDCF